MTTELAIGIMTGTSSDGIDLALVEVHWKDPRPAIEPVAHMRAAFAERLRSEVLRVSSGAPTSAADLARLHGALGDAYADAALALIAGSPARPAVIGLHGQTVAHLPAESATLQIGDGARVALRTGVPTVDDFRSADVAAGGQGAPLTPFADHLLFAGGRPRAVLNLGGIANLTLMPDEDPVRVTGWDTGPGNMVIDAIARRRGDALDRDGVGARRGRPVASALARALAHGYFSRQAPKSTGREDFGDAFAAELLAEVEGAGGSLDDALATATQLTALTVANALRPHAVREVIVAGGGVRNPALLEALGAALSPVPVVPSERYGIPAAAREAMAFAILGIHRLHGLPNTLPRCTGAARAVSAGAIHDP